MQGIIDALWLRADGKATLVDFKTQACRTEKEIQGVVDRYAMQVRLYAQVVERLLGWQVDRAGLYLTEIGRFCEVSSAAIVAFEEEEFVKRVVG